MIPNKKKNSQTQNSIHIPMSKKYKKVDANNQVF
jgi:hypothetical protein